MSPNVLSEKTFSLSLPATSFLGIDNKEYFPRLVCLQAYTTCVYLVWL